MKTNDKDFEITDTVEVAPEIGDDIGQNRFKLDSAKRNFRTRVFSTLVLLVLLLGFIGSGAAYNSLLKNGVPHAELASYFSIALTAGLTGLCVFEMNKTLGFKKWYYQLIIIVAAVFVYLYPVNKDLTNFSFYIHINMDKWLESWQMPIIITCYFLVLMVISIIEKSIDWKNTLINFGMTMLIVFALKGFSIVSLTLTSSSDQTARFSFNTILWIWVMIILSDSFQYIGGMRFGKTKLCPNISPKKTWEGALIGLSIAAIFGIVYVMIFRSVGILENFMPLKEVMIALRGKSVALEVIIYILLALIFPIIGLFGDLLFSWVKRRVNVKDYSNLIPGHGGALDRMDSILFSLFILFIFVWVTSFI
ncbi:phosphatidate cytidylyltransferase [Spiroplasma monobiae]|uniref:Phosphatidate cytidylyltransferase n=1 Tax=Spiroplasma monobiae MQ-1 TaxID=1336748 RepID=A0A2K9LUT0_SPISQ|nr:phosphatidate cytidylyltransferase [Spiroplasma monobiae]AUM62813.1 phosphatidate cytidylyltransferase [Spiroplasma monobiae MQ-1]